MDKRIIKLAKTLVDYSINVKKGENIMIDSGTLAQDLILEVYKKVIQKGAYPLTSIGLPKMTKIYYENASKQFFSGK